MAEKNGIVLDPAVARHAKSLARLLRIIYRSSKSQIEIQQKVDAYFLAVQEELIRSGIDIEEAVDLVLGTINTITGIIEKAAGARSDHPPE